MSVNNLGYVIRHWRIVKKVTLGTMAKALGMKASRLSGIETRDVEPTEEELRHIAY
ncbi:helix-turn-helix domain-containing protein [Gallibacterium anatis]|uniref:helix-turn-helix domain-containing protein n=1 Tax=Gallibacterium anatis TaxID=750 RepID=UPI00266F274A|nr:helix-turn-helix transcriptional regulator [Gallibacterium anatis]WKS98354.1 helix-turn-helix domain-containing protein [Gallibacterium anatis]